MHESAISSGCLIYNFVYDNDLTMQWLPLSGKFVHKANGQRNLHCDVVHITTK